MHKIDGEGHLNNHFVQEDIQLSRPPTVITEDWLNAVQQEIVNVIAAAAIELNKIDNEQLLKAIKKIIDNKSFSFSEDGLIGIATNTNLTASQRNRGFVVQAPNLLVSLPPLSGVEIGSTFVFRADYDFLLACPEVINFQFYSNNSGTVLKGSTIVIVHNGSSWYEIITSRSKSSVQSESVQQTVVIPANSQRVNQFVFTPPSEGILKMYAVLNMSSQAVIGINHEILLDGTVLVDDNTLGSQTLIISGMVTADGQPYTIQQRVTNTDLSTQSNPLSMTLDYTFLPF